MQRLNKIFISNKSGRKEMPRIFLIVILLFFMVFLLSAQSVSLVGTTAASFLKIGVGGRALAMGEASTTLASDVTAIYWNPAGLAQISNTQILVSHYDYIADIYYDYGAAAISFGSIGTFGFHFAYLGMPDIDRTTVLEPEGTGEKAGAYSYSTGLSYGRALTERFDIGFTVKMIGEKIWHCTASGVAMDAGVSYRTIFKNVRIGMSISNFGTSMQMDGSDLLIQYDIDPLSNGNNSNINGKLETGEYSLPVLFRVGISGNITRDFLGFDNHDLIVACDVIHPNDNYEYLNVGTEYTFKNMISLRGGYRRLFLKDTEGGLTFGFGLNFMISNIGLQLDYAAVDFGRLDYLNKFSFILSL
jgi:hypothetical protein